MVTVVAVIIVLAGLVMGVAGFVQSKGAREKCLTQIKALSVACEAYRTDNGTVPQNEDTDELDPRIHLSPIGGGSGALYQKASRYLYSCLSGDHLPDNAPDFEPEKEERRYYSFRRDELNFTKNGSGDITAINFLQDPFGNSFGYSTIAAKAEEDYRKKLRENPEEARPEANAGYNPTFDLWSTGGATSGNSKWIKNW